MDIKSEFKISCLVFTTLLVGNLVTDTMDKKAVKADQKFEAEAKKSLLLCPWGPDCYIW